MTDCFCGANGEMLCVCQTESELADTPDTGAIDQRFLLSPVDSRDEHRDPDDYTNPDWWEKA